MSTRGVMGRLLFWRKKSRLGEKDESWKEFAGMCVLAVGLSLVIRIFFVEMFWIPSSSMVPTLLKGDLIVVSKVSYGYSRYSFPFGGLPVGGRLFGDEPVRGDVLVFRGTRKNIDYVKRLVGLPGDEVQVVRGILFINGVPVRRLLLENDVLEDEFSEGKLYREKLPGGVEHFVLEMSGDRGFADETPVYKVPEGYYFVMGDNRDNSVDSRFLQDVGMVPFDHLVGKAQMVLLSFDGKYSWWAFWRWFSMLRLGRVWHEVV